MSDFLDQNRERITETIKRVVDFMDLDCDVRLSEEGGQETSILLVSLEIPGNASFLIGKNGENIRSLEHLLRAIFLKNSREGQNILVDINDYKKSRTSFIVEQVREAVTRVRNTQKAEALSPMHAYERRIVHVELASYPDP